MKPKQYDPCPKCGSLIELHISVDHSDRWECSDADCDWWTYVYTMNLNDKTLT